MHGVWGGPRLRHRQCGASLTGVCCPQMQQMYDMIMQHKRAMQDMQLLWEKALQQHQHGYDSDEEVDSELGTWEHQLRRMEMDKTRGGQGGIPGWQGRSAGRRPAFRALRAREAHSAAQEVLEAPRWDLEPPAQPIRPGARELASCACFFSDKCMVL